MSDSGPQVSQCLGLTDFGDDLVGRIPVNASTQNRYTPSSPGPGGERQTRQEQGKTLFESCSIKKESNENSLLEQQHFALARHVHAKIGRKRRRRKTHEISLFGWPRARATINTITNVCARPSRRYNCPQRTGSSIALVHTHQTCPSLS